MIRKILGEIQTGLQDPKRSTKMGLEMGQDYRVNLDRQEKVFVLDAEKLQIRKILSAENWTRLQDQFRSIIIN